FRHPGSYATRSRRRHRPQPHQRGPVTRCPATTLCRLLRPGRAKSFHRRLRPAAGFTRPERPDHRRARHAARRTQFRRNPDDRPGSRACSRSVRAAHPAAGLQPPDTSGNPRRASHEDRWDVRPLDPRSLPDRWIGLELADVIVWDDPDPSALTPAQIDAVVDWVRSGGRLVISAARNWQTINQSRLADILPVQITGQRRADEVQEFTQKILDDPDHDLDAYFAARPLTRCVVTPLAGAISLPANPAKLEGLEPIVFRRVVGHG